MVERNSGADLAKVTGESTTEEQPAFKFLTDNRIPVSKHIGKLWQSRKDQAVNYRQETGIEAAWQQADDYYHNDQLKHRGDSDGTRPANVADKIQAEFLETENVIFANVSAAVPVLYAKNPDCEVTTDDAALKGIADLVESLADGLLRRRTAPGVNAKPKIRRAVTSAFLYNLGWIEVGYVNKEDGVENVRETIIELSTEMANEKTDKQRIREIEGELLALEKRINLLSPSGPFIKYHKHNRLLRDPLSIEEDLSDANWVMMEEDWITSVLNAQFAQKDENGNFRSVYKPTHRIGATGDSAEDEEINNFSLFAEEPDVNSTAEEYFRRATDKDVTKVYRVWDKATRRVYLFHAKDWAWPIWVWDDPYEFADFFPYVPLSFYNSPRGGESKGEVSYYLDQQDGINFINSLKNQARYWAATKIIYNSAKLSDTDFKRFVDSVGYQGFGISLPDGTSLKDVLDGVDLPILSRPELLDKSDLYSAIDRTGSVSDILRGQQFKTNTTNQAIEQYTSVNQSRFDSPLDAIEDFVGIICEKLLQLCMTRMTAEEVIPLIGPTKAQQWRNLTVEEFRTLNITIVGGSTQKPTSQTKQQRAIEVGQVLGQFANANPMIVLVVMRVLSEAFAEANLTDQEEQLLMQTTMQLIAGGTQQQGNPDEPETEQPPAPTV